VRGVSRVFMLLTKTSEEGSGVDVSAASGEKQDATAPAPFRRVKAQAALPSHLMWKGVYVLLSACLSVNQSEKIESCMQPPKPEYPPTPALTSSCDKAEAAKRSFFSGRILINKRISF